MNREALPGQDQVTAMLGTSSMRDSSTGKVGRTVFGLLIVAACQPQAAGLPEDRPNVRVADVDANTTAGTTAVHIALSEEQEAVAGVVRQAADGSDAVAPTVRLTAADTADHEIVPHRTPSEQRITEATQVGVAERKKSSDCLARGIQLAIAGRYAESREQLTKALKLDRFNDAAATGLDMVHAAASGRVRPEVAALMFRGLGDAREGRLDDAITAWKKAAELAPGYAPAHTNLGAAYLSKRMMEEAAQCFRKVLESDPNDGAAHNNMGLYWVSKGEWDKAIAEFERAVALKPTPGLVCAALNNAGLTYEEKGVPAAALAMFQNVLAIDPNDSEAHYNLACHYYHKGEFELAISHCDKAKELGRQPHPNLVERLRPYR